MNAPQRFGTHSYRTTGRKDPWRSARPYRPTVLVDPEREFFLAGLPRIAVVLAVIAFVIVPLIHWIAR